MKRGDEKGCKMDVDSVDRPPASTNVDCWRQLEKKLKCTFHDQLYYKKYYYVDSDKIIFFIFQNFEFLLYFCHENLKQILMPKIPQKLEIFEN